MMCPSHDECGLTFKGYTVQRAKKQCASLSCQHSPAKGAGELVQSLRFGYAGHVSPPCPADKLLDGLARQGIVPWLNPPHVRVLQSLVQNQISLVICKEWGIHYGSTLSPGVLRIEEATPALSRIPCTEMSALCKVLSLKLRNRRGGALPI